MSSSEIEKVLLKTRRTVLILNSNAVDGSTLFEKIVHSFSVETAIIEIVYIRSNLAKNAVFNDEASTAIVWDVAYWDFFREYLATATKEQLRLLFLRFLQSKYEHYPSLCKALQTYAEDYPKILNSSKLSNDDVFRLSQLLVLHHEIAHIVFKGNYAQRMYCFGEVRRIFNRLIQDAENNLFGIDLKTVRYYAEDGEGLIEELAADYFAVKEMVGIVSEIGKSVFEQIHIILEGLFSALDFNRAISEIELNWQRYYPMIISKHVKEPSTQSNSILHDSYIKNILGFVVSSFLIFEYFDDQNSVLNRWSEIIESYIGRLAICHDVIFELTYDSTIRRMIKQSHQHNYQ